MIQKSVGCSIVPIKGELRYLLLSMSTRRDKERSQTMGKVERMDGEEKERWGEPVEPEYDLAIAINDPVVCVCIEVNKAPGAKGNT